MSSFLIHLLFLLQFPPVRRKCLQGKSRQVPVCGLYGHLPLSYQNRGPAVWRPTGPKNVWGYRLGELLLYLSESIMLVMWLVRVRVNMFTHSWYLLLLLHRHFSDPHFLPRSWRRPLRRKHLSTTVSCLLWFDPQNSCCPQSLLHHQSKTWYEPSCSTV